MHDAHPAGLKFSLILATLGRTADLRRFLSTLDAQSYRNFELIVVDQNPDERLTPILAEFRDCFPLRHLRSEPGLSRARNVGLRQISGDVVAFPDDDCWYPMDLLETVALFFAKHPEIGGLAGRSADENGKDTAGKFHHKSCQVDKLNVWKCANSVTIFLRCEVAYQTGLFDPELGVGAGTRYLSGEETDYVLRALQARARILYDRNLIVHHPDPVQVMDQRAFQRAYQYGCGMGRVLKKHHYPLRFIAKCLLRPLGGIFLSLMQGDTQRARNYCFVLRGRLEGWLH